MAWKYIGTTYRNKRGQLVRLHLNELVPGVVNPYRAVRICTESGLTAYCSPAMSYEHGKRILRNRAKRYGWDEVPDDEQTEGNDEC